jgi:transposase
MARYKPVDRNPKLLPVVYDEQILPGTFEYALDYLIDQELDLSGLDRKFKNNVVGAWAYDPRVMLKIVLLAYSRGMISSREIESACRKNVLFMALSGDSAPQFTTIARFVRDLKEQIAGIFTQVLMTCDEQGLIGKKLFAIDGVKLPSNASKYRSGTHAELEEVAQRMERTVQRLLDHHRDEDELSDDPVRAEARSAKRIESLGAQAQRIRTFLKTREPRRNAKGEALKSNVTDDESAKMATSKGVLQGFTAIAAVDEHHQVIVAADVHGSGSEQATLLPMVSRCAPVMTEQTIITADAGYHSEANLAELHERGIPALIADGQMRQRDERFKDQGKHKAKPDPLYDKSKSPGQPIKFRPKDFSYDPETNRCICPAGKPMYSNGSHCTTKGLVHHKFTGAKSHCVPCPMRTRCLRHPERTQVRQVSIFEKDQASRSPFTQRMRQAIDSERGRRLYGRRMATVEPVFGNIRHNKRLNRFTLRGKSKVNVQWNLYCLVHNVEKLANHGYAVRP